MSTLPDSNGEKKRSVMMSVRLTHEDAESLKSGAAAAGLSVSDFLRSLVSVGVAPNVAPGESRRPVEVARVTHPPIESALTTAPASTRGNDEPGALVEAECSEAVGESKEPLPLSAPEPVRAPMTSIAHPSVPRSPVDVPVAGTQAGARERFAPGETVVAGGTAFELRRGRVVLASAGPSVAFLPA